MAVYEVRKRWPQPFKGKVMKVGDILTSDDIGNGWKETQFLRLNWVVPSSRPAEDSVFAVVEDADKPDGEANGGDNGDSPRRGRPARAK